MLPGLIIMIGVGALCIILGLIIKTGWGWIAFGEASTSNPSFSGG